MILIGGLRRNPFRFQITPSATTPVDHYYPLSLAPAAFWTHARSDGGDIRVYKQDGTQAARQLTAFDPVAKTGSLWIRGNSGTSFWVTYGNAAWTEPAANSTYGSQATWETALKVVLHGHNFNDATLNANNGSHSAGVTANNAGKIGGAFASSSSTDYISIAHNSSLVFSNWSMSAWINVSWSPGGIGRIANKAVSNTGFQWRVANPSSSPTALTLQQTPGQANSTGTFSQGAWHHVAFSQDSNSATIQYIDGVGEAPVTIGAPSSMPAAPLMLFNRDDLTRILYARIEGFRVWDRIVSGTEFANMYANQNSPATYWTTGAEQSV